MHVPISIEINPKYCEKVAERIRKTALEMKDKSMANGIKGEAG